MKALSARSGIKVDMSGTIQQKRLTTKFSGIELERGIARLMTLMKEKNYTMKYDTTGRVNEIEFYGTEPPAAAPAKAHTRPEVPKTLPKTLQPAVPSEQPLTGVQKNPPPQRRLIPPSRPAVSRTGPAAPKSQDPSDEDEGEADVDELPYIAPQKKVPAPAKQQ
jgi:hypothetical protein